jgi:Ni/Co efflux regulator RcnB
MKTTLAFIITLVLAAISASALAMPCAQKAGALQEVRDTQHQVRLHLASQERMRDSIAVLRTRAVISKVSDQILRLAV